MKFSFYPNQTIKDSFKPEFQHEMVTRLDSLIVPTKPFPEFVDGLLIGQKISGDTFKLEYYPRFSHPQAGPDMIVIER